MSDIFWTRSNGQKVPIKDMGDHHLLSAIAMMRRNGYVSAADIALFDSDPVKYPDSVKPGKVWPVSTLLDALDTEARNRGLIK